MATGLSNTAAVGEDELRERLRVILEAEITPAEAAQYALGNKSAITNIMIEQLLQLIRRREQALTKQLLDEVEERVIVTQDKKEYWPVWRKELFERQRQALQAMREEKL